jgi:O-antigen/teichoic acid export membrane protein
MAAAAGATLVASAGLSQTVSRMKDDELSQVPGLWIIAWVVGILCASTLYLARDVIAAAWGAPEAASSLRVFSIATLSAPIFGISGALLRREGRFRVLATAMLLSSIVGMGLGLGAVLLFRNAEALAVASVASQVLLTVFAVGSTRRYLFVGVGALHAETLKFSAKVVAISGVQYVIGNAPRFAGSHALPLSTLGQWNRAEVMSSVPFQQLQGVLVPVVYPEFRHDRESSERAFSAWTDMLILLSWVTIPLGFVGAGVLPFLIPVLFGDQWSGAAMYAVPLAIIGGFQPVVVLLSVAIEALSMFRVIALVTTMQVAAQIVLVVAIVKFESVWLALSASGISLLIGHVVFLRYANRKHLLDARAVVRNYAMVVSISSIFSGFIALGILGASSSSVALLAVLAAWIAISTILWRTRNRFPPMKILRRRGLIGGRQRFLAGKPS